MIATAYSFVLEHGARGQAAAGAWSTTMQCLQVGPCTRTLDG